MTAALCRSTPPYDEVDALCRSRVYFWNWGAELISPQDRMAVILVDDIFIFCLNENDRIPISLKFVPMSLIDNNPTLVRVKVCTKRATSHYLDNWWSSSPTHICSTRGRWIKYPDPPPLRVLCWHVVGFDHGLPCRVKNMARGTQ